MDTSIEMYKKSDIKSFDDLEALLKRPFEPKEIFWRVSRANMRNGKPNINVLAYIDSRAVMDRLDQLFGVQGWSDRYEELVDGGFKCELKVQFGSAVAIKTDGAPHTNVEKVKGGFSDALKRTAVKFGIGRYLYNLTENTAKVVDNFHAQSVKIDGKWFNWEPPALPKFARPKSVIHPELESWEKAKEFLAGKEDKDSALETLLGGYFIIPSHLEQLLEEAGITEKDEDEE